MKYNLNDIAVDKHNRRVLADMFEGALSVNGHSQDIPLIYYRGSVYIIPAILTETASTLCGEVGNEETGNVNEKYVSRQDLIDIGWNTDSAYLNDNVVDDLNNMLEKYPWQSAAWYWNIQKKSDGTTLNTASLVEGSIVTRKVNDDGTMVTVTGNSTIFDVTYLVNGGTNGIADRIKYYNLVKKHFGGL